MKKPGTEKEDKGRELLKKAAELIEEQPEPAAPPDKAPESRPRSGLSEKRKQALINYMAILFAVAFLLVALSLAIQYRDSQNTISQLGANARTAVEKAETLQDKNQKLTQDLTDAQNALAAANQQLSDVQNAMADLENANESLKGSNSELTQEKMDALNTAAVYQYLARAQAALASGDGAALRSTLDQLKTLSKYLSAEDQTLYQSLFSQSNQ